MGSPLEYKLPSKWLIYHLSVKVLFLFLLAVAFTRNVWIGQEISGTQWTVYLVLTSMCVVVAGFDVYDFFTYRAFLCISESGVEIFGTMIPWVAINDITVGDHSVMPAYIRPYLILMMRDPSALYQRKWSAISRVRHDNHQNVWLSGFMFDVHVDHVRLAMEKYRKVVGEPDVAQQMVVQERGDRFRRQTLYIVWAGSSGLALLAVIFILPAEAPLSVRVLMLASVFAAGALYVIAGLKNLKK